MFSLIQMMARRSLPGYFLDEAEHPIRFPTYRLSFFQGCIFQMDPSFLNTYTNYTVAFVQLELPQIHCNLGYTIPNIIFRKQ